jgi:hypothetical protein
VRKLFLAALLAALAPGARAQHSGSHFSPTGFTRTFSHSRNSHGTPHSLFDPLGIFSDPFFSGALSLAGYPPAGQPSGFNPSPSSGGMPEQFPPPAQPLLIELQGNSYVRVSGPEGIPTETLRRDPMRSNEFSPRLNSGRSNAGKPNARSRETASISPAPTPLVPVNPAPATLAPVTLIFRDGHRDQISDYTIANGAIYTRANFYTDGSWNKKIELSSLDLNETLKQNQSPTAQFRLPAASNEVITRP